MRARRVGAGLAAAGLLVGLGISVAAPSSAADLGSYTANCGPAGRVDSSITGQVGDTFTVLATGAACSPAATPSGVVSYIDSYYSSGSTITVTLSAAGTTTFQFQQLGDGLWIAVTATAVPTADVADGRVSIPAWVQAYGRDEDATCLDGWEASWQSWAEPVTGGWVCTRSIPSLG